MFAFSLVFFRRDQAKFFGRLPLLKPFFHLIRFFRKRPTPRVLRGPAFYTSFFYLKDQLDYERCITPHSRRRSIGLLFS